MFYPSLFVERYMIKPLISFSLIVGALLIVKSFFIVDQTPEETNTPQESAQVKQDAFEKTVSRKSITGLVNSPELSPEQAEIFYASLPNSLADSPAPTPLDVDEQGLLIINMKVKRLFEFYLSAMGEDTLAECVLRIRHDLAMQLQGPALDSALEILEGFLQYQNNIGAIKNDFVARYSDAAYDLNRVSEMKAAVRQSRDLFFSSEAANAFYQQEDEYDDYMLKQVAIRSDASLSHEEKQTHYAALDAAAPAWIIEQDRQANLVSQVRQQEQAIRERGGDEYEIQTLREEQYGTQAAQNLALLDEQRALWSRRMAQYRSESQHINLSDAYTQTEKEQLLSDIRQQHFSGSELVRVKALDKIAR